MPDAGTITRLLTAAETLDSPAADELYRLVQQDLQQIARKRKRVVGVGMELDASTTGLVDEAFCRLMGGDSTTWHPGDRRKFFSYMSRKIHGDLIDLLRREQAEKRGGRLQREDLEDYATSGRANPMQMLIDMQVALEKFEKIDPDGAAVVRYRHFLGSTFEEVAELLSMSKTETIRTHQRAMLWLKRELKEYDLDS